MQRLLGYATGALALIIVAAAAGSAVTYAMMHGTQTLTLLGNAALSGIGMAIGGCLGSALVLRFKAARRFISDLLKEINAKHDPWNHLSAALPPAGDVPDDDTSAGGNGESTSE